MNPAEIQEAMNYGDNIMKNEVCVELDGEEYSIKDIRDVGWGDSAYCKIVLSK